MKRIFSKQFILAFILTLSLCTFFVGSNYSTVYAQNSNAESSEEQTSTNAQFDVSEYLKIEGGQTYLEEDKVEEHGITYFIIEGIEILTRIIGSFALVFVIAGGIILMISSGNEDLQRRGKEIIKYALIGLVIAFTSLLVVTFVQSLFFTI